MMPSTHARVPTRGGGFLLRCACAHCGVFGARKCGNSRVGDARACGPADTTGTSELLICGVHRMAASCAAAAAARDKGAAAALASHNRDSHYY